MYFRSKADELFPTSSEEEVEEIRPQTKTKRSREESRSSSSMPILNEEGGELERKRTKREKQSSTRRGEPAVSTEPIRPSLKKLKIRPVTRPTARELFGTDSEDEAQEAACASSSSSSKKVSTLVSSITRRLANGISRQGHPSKEGSHYIDLKVYKVSDIENVSAMNRWRQAVISLKTKTDDNTEAWGYLAKFITASRKEFKDIPPTFISNYY